jgi:hypothetical protein
MSELIETGLGAPAASEGVGDDMHIHKPKAAHSVRAFISEIGVIVVGIAIALAGEQAVEAVHRNVEVSALRLDLHAESRQILADAQKCEAQSDYELRWLNKRIAQVQAAVWQGRSLAAHEPNDKPTCASPDIPIWRSARSGGKTNLLTKGEVNAFAEVEYVQAHLDSYLQDSEKAEGAVRGFNRQLPTLPDGEPDFSVASRQDLRDYLVLLTNAANSIDRYKTWLRVLIGAEEAVVAGKDDLNDIYASERKAGVGDVTHDPM